MAQKEQEMGLRALHTSGRSTKADWTALHMRLAAEPLNTVDAVPQLRTLTTAPPAAPPDPVLADLATVPAYAAPKTCERL